MWIIVLSLSIIAVLAWVFLGFALKKQLRFATLIFDLLPLYPLLSFAPSILISVAGLLWLSPFYSLCLFIASLSVSIAFAYHFIKWSNQYRWKVYLKFLKNIKDKRYETSLFSDYHKMKDNQSIVPVFIRHDVDISLSRTKKMAELEKKMGVISTYFFRMHAERYSFDEAIPIIQNLHKEGFGIGLHYDMVTYTKGNKEKALVLFKEDLAKIRAIAPIHCVCAHGGRRYRNRDIWADINQEALEVYSAYDLEQDMYISDAGGKRLIDLKGKHILEKIDEAQQGHIIQILIHPDWWY
ncbi:MAG: hypothetical protein ACTSRU_14940 [Candidatus Hodarchaeales archaeon]